MTAPFLFMIKTYAKTRQLVDWQSVTDGLDDTVIMPVNIGVFRVASVLLATRGLWPSTYRVSHINTYTYNSPEKASTSWILLEDAISKFITDGVEFVTRFDELITSVNKLDKLDAITSALVDIKTEIGDIDTTNPTEDELTEIVTKLAGIIAALGV